MKETENTRTSPNLIMAVMFFFIIACAFLFPLFLYSRPNIIEEEKKTVCGTIVKFEFEINQKRIIIPALENGASGFFIGEKEVGTSCHLVKKRGDKVMIPPDSKVSPNELMSIYKYHYFIEFEKRIYKAELKNFCFDSDTATLIVPNIDPSIHGISKEGDPDKLEEGNCLRIIGDPWSADSNEPFKFKNTMTEGIVSAKHRKDLPNIAYGKYVQDYIQTDCHACGGNSGGPGFNKNGEMVGILTAGERNVSHFNFLVPIYLYQRRDLMGEIKIPCLGCEALIEFIRTESEKDDLDRLKQANVFGQDGDLLMILREMEKRKISSVVNFIYPKHNPNSFQNGDIITHVDNYEIKDGMDVRIAITKSGKKAGDTATINFLRPEKGRISEHEINAILIERPSDPPDMQKDDNQITVQ